METTLPSDDPSAPPTAAYSRWILIDEYFGGRDDPDARTVAHARTSRGRPISVSFVLAAPPAASRLRLNSPGLPDNSGLPQHNGVSVSCHAMAAHGDSVLVKIETRTNGGSSWGDCDDGLSSDHFIYCAGDAAADPSRPPSLSLLPPCYVTDQGEGRQKEKHYLDEHGTALLRRGKDEVLVAALNFRVKNREGWESREAKLCLLRSDNWEWELKRLPVIHEDKGKRQEVTRWKTGGVIPVGDRFLLWVDYRRGIIYSDLWQEKPELRYVPLPEADGPCRPYDRGSSSNRGVCSTDGGRAVRFVKVFPRCCCGCPGRTDCEVSRHAFTITTWALRMDDMTTWDKVSVVDCNELWSLHGYHGVVPRIRPEYPTVSLDDPDVLCFMVHKDKYQKGADGDDGKRLIALDTRRMELRSICYYDDEFHFCSNFVASAVSQYFDASSRSRTPARRIDADLEAPARPLKLTFPSVFSPEKMLATLGEIPDMARDDMLKAYGVLASDESRFKFRSLLALPMDMRKDYCLLIGKLSSFVV